LDDFLPKLFDDAHEALQSGYYFFEGWGQLLLLRSDPRVNWKKLFWLVDILR
jgi:hypothetical protein